MDSLLNTLERYLNENYEAGDTLLCKNITPRASYKKPSPSTPQIKIQKKAPLSKKAPPKPLAKKAPLKPKVVLEKPKTETTSKNSELFSIYSKIAPHLSIHKEPLDDQLAKHVKLAWQDHKNLPPVPIFIDKSLKNHFKFLTNLSKAISIYFVPSTLYDITDLEKDNRYDNLFTKSEVKFIIIPDTLLWQSPNLITHYKEVPNQMIKKIGQFPTIVLPDIETFYKTPSNKYSLWKLLSQNLKTVL